MATGRSTARGIFGLLLSRGGPLSVAERLGAMAGDLSPGACLFEGERIGVCAGADADTAASGDGLVRVFHDGARFRPRELADELARSGSGAAGFGAAGFGAGLLLAGYEAWGAEGLAERLSGEHAFCVWDGRTRTAYLVRDRLGLRPLYFVSRAPGLAFATSLRAVARSGLCLPKLDEEALWGLLYRDAARGRRTLLAGVERVPAGGLVEWSAETGAVAVREYWSVPNDPGPVGTGADEAAERVRALLEESVGAGLDGPVAVACSLQEGLGGGVVAALAARAGWKGTVVAYEGSGKALARAVGAARTPVHAGRQEVLAAVERLLAGSDEPTSEAAVFASLFFARAAAGGASAVLSGAGADELFGGHAYYRAFAARRRMAAHERLEEAARLEARRRAMAGRMGHAFPAPREGLASPHAATPLAAQPEFVWALLAPDRRPPAGRFREALEAIEGEPLADAGTLRTPLQRALYLDLRVGLERRLAARVGEPARLHGVEGRAPIADPAVVELMLGLPDALKIEGDEGAVLLRRIARSVLTPDAVADVETSRPPTLLLERALPEILLDCAREQLRESALVAEGIVSERALEALEAAHAELGHDVGPIVWALLAADRWWRRVRADVVAALPERGAIPTAAREGEATVDVVIPVYESINLLRDCVRSIRAFTERPFRAVVVDDAGREASHLRLLEIVGDDPRFEVVRNEKNLGFLRTCERALARSTADYVVLLNSDTVVTPGWLERMVACAESDPRIAVVNPLSNEAVNLSVRFAPGLNITSMARRVAELSERRYPDVTTAVGMCLLLRRSALDLLGGFDEAFAPAYCEESDLCMRFTEAGLRVVVADDAFVYHKGSASYGEETKSRHYERNREEFDRRWAAAYERDWAAYARRDPLQYLRDALLRDTVAPEESHPDRYAAVEARLGRLETSEVAAATGDGALARAAAVMLPERAPHARGPALSAAVRRRERPPSAFGARALVFPTRRYVRALPPAAPDKLRVTFLVSSLPLAGGVISILHVARELMLAGHDVKVVTEAHEIAPEVLNLWTQPLVYRDREHLFEAFPESDVVVATWWVTAHLYMRELRRRYSFVAAYYIQDYEALFYPETEVEARRDAARSYDWADHHVYASRWIADRVGPREAKSEVIPLDVDLDIFYPRGNRDPRRPRVVSVAAPGVETRRRGFPETVEAFRLIHEARPDVELVFFGAEQSRMPELPFPYTNAGRLYDQNRVADLVSSSQVLVDASLWQGFGRPGLEAMACGTVPVLTGEGGLHEYARDGENCILTPSGDSEAVAAGVLRLLDDGELRERLSGAGRRMAACFSHRLIAARHLELYSRWVREARQEQAADERR